MFLRFLAITIALYAGPAFSKECVVISGDEKDHNDAFTNDTFLKKDSDFRGFQCKRFNSWKEASDYLQKQKVKRDEPLLVIQGAHGSPGGEALCNAGEESPEHILGYLDEFAERYHYQVGAIIQSCFSGDLMRLKLEGDAIRNKPAKEKNLCLVTASQFGKSAFKGKSLNSTELSRKQTLESYMLENLPDGMISSAAWDGYGLTDYLIRRKTTEAGAILNRLNGLLKSCTNDIAKRTMDFCTKESVTASFYEESLKIQKATFDFDAALNNQLASLEMKISIAKGALPKNDPAKEKNRQLKLRCLENFRDSLESWKFDTYEKGNSISAQFEPFLREFSSPGNTSFKECSEVVTMEEPKVETPSDERPVPPVIPNLVNGKSSFSSKIDPTMEFHLLGDLSAIVARDQESVQKIEAELNRSPNPCRKDSDEYAILMNLLGQNDYYPGEESSAKSEFVQASKFSSHEVLKAFNSSSVALPKLTNPHDKARREACRNFKL